ncbi:MAG: 2Fe-2S iron-sulfur cluster binding domain-containing protein [Emcibacter sp.]|nr:2Fe-2S iron-sulfur cluster binding domain-containing protein [Emcibacter sp.]
MSKLIVVTRDGEEKILSGSVGSSVLEVIHDAGIEDLMALCGGCCSCATCHVYVDDEWISAAGAANEDEADLLEDSEHRKTASRLACQIKITDKLDGLRVIVAPED